MAQTRPQKLDDDLIRTSQCPGYEVMALLSGQPDHLILWGFLKIANKSRSIHELKLSIMTEWRQISTETSQKVRRSEL